VLGDLLQPEIQRTAHQPHRIQRDGNVLRFGLQYFPESVTPKPLPAAINMANTFTQIHIHVVFAVQNRISLISKSWQERLYKYMIAVIQKHGHKVLSVGGMPDHVHILFGFRPTQALSNLIQEVKRDSSEWINKEKLVMGRFSWQEGYGAFSYSKSHIPQVAHYIECQEEHHKKRSFLEEYKKILKDFDLEYDEHYIFTPVEE
jgi:REP element-mobilizing transposase RayT